MKNCARILSIYASDTAGVCSMLYELGGMVVVHDASGCNSTYATHDEPRWYSNPAMIYISALTEMDAIMGGDARLLEEAARTARELRPKFIALCGSPMPYMTGVDFTALAAELECMTGIPVLGLHTNGIRSYIAGAGEALKQYLQRFADKNVVKSKQLSVNLLGATPLDFSGSRQTEAIRNTLQKAGIAVQSCMAMDSTPEELQNCGKAQVNLLLSMTGFPAAKYLKETFGIPFVAGVPYGEKFAEKVLQDIRLAAEDGQDRFPCADRTAPEGRCLAIVGESIGAASLAAASEVPARVLVPQSLMPEFLLPQDAVFADEDEVEHLFGESAAILADPMYQPAAPANIPFYRLPHEAFSGRCYREEIPVLTGRNNQCGVQLC